MFCRRYSPFVHDIYEMDVMPRPRRQVFMPEEVFAVLGPWAEKQGCGGKMCKRKPRIKDGKVAIPKRQEHRPAMKFKITEEPWETVVHADGFKPRDYTIFAQGRTLFINGVRSEGDEDTGIVKTEFRRKVTIPDDVILPSLSIDFQEGKLVISARKRVIRMDPEVEEVKEKQQEETTTEKKTERNDLKKKEMEIPIYKEVVAAPASEASEVNADDKTSSVLENSECPCKESSDCANCDSGNESVASEDVVSIEDIGPEEDMEEVRSEATEGYRDSLIIDEPKVVSERVQDATQDKGKAVHPGDAQKTQNSKMDAEVCEYKPLTWSVRLPDFDAKDVKVRLEDDKVRVIAEHEEENNGITFFHQMERTFALLRNAERDTLRSRFCEDDGTLMIEVMPKNETQTHLTEKSERLPAEKEPEQTIKLAKDELGWTVLPISFE